MPVRHRKAKLVQGRQSSPDGSKAPTPETDQVLWVLLVLDLSMLRWVLRCVCAVAAGHYEHPWVVSKLSFWGEVLINIAGLNGL